MILKPTAPNPTIDAASTAAITALSTATANANAFLSIAGFASSTHDLAALVAIARERDAYAENLTSVHERCNTLLEEARAARRALADIEPLVGYWQRLEPLDRQILIGAARRLAGSK